MKFKEQLVVLSESYTFFRIGRGWNIEIPNYQNQIGSHNYGCTLPFLVSSKRIGVKHFLLSALAIFGGTSFFSSIWGTAPCQIWTIQSVSVLKTALIPILFMQLFFLASQIKKQFLHHLILIFYCTTCYLDGDVFQDIARIHSK